MLGLIACSISARKNSFFLAGALILQAITPALKQRSGHARLVVSHGSPWQNGCFSCSWNILYRNISTRCPRNIQKSVSTCNRGARDLVKSHRLEMEDTPAPRELEAHVCKIAAAMVTL